MNAPNDNTALEGGIMPLDSMIKFLKLNWLARTPFEYNHAHVIARLRFAAGVVLVVIAAILYGSGSGGWWRALLVVVAAGAFYGAYRMPRAVEEERAARR
jgi:hypothetical protein